MGMFGRFRPSSGDHGQIANTSRATGTLLPRGVAGPMDPNEAGKSDGLGQQDVMAGKMSSDDYHASSYAGDERMNPNIENTPHVYNDEHRLASHASSQNSYYGGLRSSYGR